MDDSGRRARADQVATRVNTAVGLLADGMSVADATASMSRRYRLSSRQARRYVQRARDQGPMDVPGARVVFSVKLPAALARRVRQRAKATGQSISALVAEALGEFLDRHRPGGSGRG